MYVVVIGGGNVGYYLTKELLAAGHEVVMIEKDPVRARWAEDEKIAVIVGNASSEEVLAKAKIDRARGFIQRLTVWTDEKGGLFDHDTTTTSGNEQRREKTSSASFAT